MNDDVWNIALDEIKLVRIKESLAQLALGEDAASRLLEHWLTMSDIHVNYLIAQMLLAIRTTQEQIVLLDMSCDQLEDGRDAAARLLRYWQTMDDGVVTSFISECLQAIAAAQRVLKDASHG